MAKEASGSIISGDFPTIDGVLHQQIVESHICQRLYKQTPSTDAQSHFGIGRKSSSRSFPLVDRPHGVRRSDADHDDTPIATVQEVFNMDDLTTEAQGPPTLMPPSLRSKFDLKLNIVIQIVGSRGDVQPFIALGIELQKHGHRVRLATHDVFETFVTESGLEFFPVGGDPAELMAYMVKNPGIIPSMASLRNGEIERKRKMIRTMLKGFWRSCLTPDSKTGEPFVANAIIANPPSFAHVHCAQALGIPVHLMFTMPWTSTKAFPHPLARMRKTKMREDITNYVSYAVVEWLTWQGLADIINEWRQSMDLEEIPLMDGSALIQRLQVPFTYCWSPALVPKPDDWSKHIDVCGFFFRNAPAYTPPHDLVHFIRNGSVPVYIGFGSIVVENPEKISETIREAVKLAGVRAIISKGWSNFGGAQRNDIFYIEDCPHEWLFQQVRAVIHHGGAGTTACGLKYGKPTAIVPFFGDQPFWGDMISRAGAGPTPVHHTKLTAEKLAAAITFTLSEAAVNSARTLAQKMSTETGVSNAVESFHRQLPLCKMRCDILPDQPAVYSYTNNKTLTRLSHKAVQALLSKYQIKKKHLKLYQAKPFSIEATRWDPISGFASATMATSVNIITSFTGTFTAPYKQYQVRRNSQIEKTGAPLSTGKPRESMTPTYTTITTPIHNPFLYEDNSKRCIAKVSAKSFGKIGTSAIRGLALDIPLAFAEGLKSIPGHYNGGVRDHGPITGMKSGAIVAGKTLIFGFTDGFGDLVIQPYKGARKDGVVGSIKGVPKGFANLAVKTSAGLMGLYAYNSQGVAKSWRSATKKGRERRVMLETSRETESLSGEGMACVNVDEVVRAFWSLKTRIRIDS